MAIESLQQPRGKHCERRDAREVLKVIRDERISEGIDVKKAQRRHEGDAEDEHGGQGSARTTAQEPTGSEHSKNPNQVGVLPPRGRIDVPPWIDEGQPKRPNQREHVKTDRTTGDEQTIEDTRLELDSTSAVQRGFEPGGQDPGREPDTEKRNER